MTELCPQLSIVVPVYRSEATLDALSARLASALAAPGLSYEMIFVEDGGGDGSWERLCDIQRKSSVRVVVVQLMRNFGQHNALMCGFRHARGAYVVTIDDDLQHPPEEIPKLLEAIESRGDDAVYGVPRRRHHRHWRNLGSWLVATFYRLVFRSRMTPSAFRIIRRELVDAILRYELNYTYIDGLLAWNSSRISQILVEHCPRPVGRSGYSLGKLAVLAVNLFTNFSLLPLQLVSLVGLLAACGGLFVAAHYLAKYLLAEIAVPGYASTIIAILVLGGLQLLSMGVIGEYLGRLHLNVNRKPQYTIRELRHGPCQPPLSAQEDEHPSTEGWDALSSGGAVHGHRSR